MKLCLISNSTNHGEPYLGWPRTHIQSFLNKHNVKKVLFIPFAGVNLSTESLEKSYDMYEAKVAAVYQELGFELTSIHKETDPIKAVVEAECVAVGGGNTFHLVKTLHETGLMKAIRERALAGMPYMGWSAGSNVACPSLRTTNDMPIVEPASFDCMNLIPFQINPHYLDANPEGHGGETREQRLEEFLAMNKEMKVAGLREGCLIEVDGDKKIHTGNRSLRIFEFGKEAREFEGEDISFLF